MTVAVNDAITQITAVGGEPTFTYDFPIDTVVSPALHELVVETVTGAAAPVTLTEGVDYTVTGAGNPLGGTIVLDIIKFPAGAIAGVFWTIYRSSSEIRPTDFQTSGDFFATEVNLQMDKLTKISQDQRRDLDLRIFLPISGSLKDIEAPAPTPGTPAYWRWDAAGNKLEGTALTTTGAAVGYDDTSTDATKDKLVDDLRMNDLSQIVDLGVQKMKGDRTIENGFVYRKTIRLAGLTAFETKLTLSNDDAVNNFFGYAKVSLMGHTTTLGNGSLVEEFQFDGAGVGVSIRKLEIGPNPPKAQLAFSGGDTLVQVQSNDGVAEFRGVLEIEVFIARDFDAGDATEWTLT